jgi:hypothetical protein
MNWNSDIKGEKMKKILGAAVFLYALAGVQQAQGSSFDLSLNDYSVQAQLSGPITEDYYGTSEFNVRLLYNERRKVSLASTGVEFITQLNEVPGLAIGFGAEALGGKKRSPGPNQDMFAVTIGTRLYYYPAELSGLGFQAKLFYAPRIVSFSDLERLLERGVRVSYAISPMLQIYTEYQNIRVKFDELGSQTIDDHIRFGFVASF